MDKHGFGTSYPSGDVRQLTKIISGYANDEALRTVHGQSGRGLCETELSPASVNQAFAEYLEDVVRESKLMWVSRSSWVRSRIDKLFG
jgi:hypothetical protein